MKLEIIAINPKTNKIYSFPDSTKNDLRTVNNKQFFFYNNFQPLWEVVEVKEISQNKIDAENSYFEKYGTACE